MKKSVSLTSFADSKPGFGWAWAMLLFACTSLLHTAELYAAEVYVIHGIDGRDLELEQALPVDIRVTSEGVDECLQNVAFTDVLGPVTLPTGAYNATISLANGSCTGTVAITQSFELQLAENTTLVAHLSEAGSPKLTKFVNDVRSLERHSVRASVRHLAAVNEVSAVFAINRRSRAFFDLVNGQGKAAEIRASRYNLYVVDKQLGYWNGVAAGPIPVTLGAGTVTYYHAVGSLKNGTFTAIPLVLNVN